MQIMNGEFFFWLAFGLGISFLPFSLFLIIMHLLMPQAILDRYWKEPYFRPFELMLFSGWSFFAPVRTIMFMGTFLFPRLGKKRGIIEPHRLVPRWYRIAAIVMDMWIVVAFLGGTSIFFGFLVYAYIIDDPGVSWIDMLGIAVTIACFAFVAIRHWWLNRCDDKAKHARYQHRKKNKPT